MNRRWIWMMAGAGVALAATYRRRARTAAPARRPPAGGRASAADDRLTNEASEESFPASDPPARTPLVGAKAWEGKQG